MWIDRLLSIFALHIVPSISFELVDISVRRSFDCDFDSSPCGWKCNEPWVLTDSILLPCPVHALPRRLPASGRFMGAQGRFGSEKEGDLVSPPFPSLQRGGLLTFKYSKQTSVTKLEILHREGDSTSLIDSISDFSLLPWLERQVIVPVTEGESQIIFRVSSVLSSFDVVGVDDIRLRELADGELIHRGPSVISPFHKAGVRRSPIKSSDRESCPAVKCDFSIDYCSWMPSGTFKITDRKVVTEGRGEASLTTEPITLPPNAHINFELFTSDSSTVSFLARSPSGEENLIWTNGGIVLSGWNKIRMPIRYSPSPTTVIVRTTVPSAGFVALKYFDLTDELGKGIYCGQSISVIRPNRASDQSMTRLTAIQSVEPLEPLQSSSLLPSPPSLPPPPPSSPFLSSSPLRPSFISSPSVSSLPISPSIIRSPSIFDPLSFLSPLTPRDNFPIHSITGEPKGRIDRPVPRRTPHTTVPPPPPTAPKSISDIISGIGGQPILEAQLKTIAKKFGFDNIHGERAQAALTAAKRIFGEAGVNNFLVQSAKASMSSPTVQIPSGVRPILPVNAPSEGGESHHNEEVTLFKNVPSLHSQFAQKVQSLVGLPEHIESRENPLARNSVDFIFQNAARGVKEDAFWANR